MSETYRLDPEARRRNLARAAGHYDQSAVLQREIAGRLLERVVCLKMRPSRILDLGSRTGHSTGELARLFPDAEVVGVDQAAILATRGNDSGHRVAGQLPALPFRRGAFDLVFSNLELHWCMELVPALETLRQVLAPKGAVMFTTFGPDTLVELRYSWQQADELEHVHGFVDMHDIGDALMRAGFADPVMDVDRVTLTYPKVRDLLQDLRNTGAQNALCSRRRTLTGARRYQTMCDHYEHLRNADGLVPARFEVIYGHAWAPPTGTPERHGDHEVVTIPVDQIGRKKTQGK
ncbi:MAG: malonyl-[acyl-carrier protein] O-methyltransferase BioC [Gammaproteobacteria bacterium]|nr:MAG: malonyl-[acyl-carrier protein] O-methyltransferase BioC [Gammaproteobacteria bacterium]